jgi:hypothetical protein
MISTHFTLAEDKHFPIQSKIDQTAGKTRFVNAPCGLLKARCPIPGILVSILPPKLGTRPDGKWGLLFANEARGRGIAPLVGWKAAFKWIFESIP